jgi:hypothetical protein
MAEVIENVGFGFVSNIIPGMPGIVQNSFGPILFHFITDSSANFDPGPFF